MRIALTGNPNSGKTTMYNALIGRNEKIGNWAGVTVDRNENPDVIINIVDATNLSRSLFFITQLLELGIPVVVALNKSDVNEKKGTKIQKDKVYWLSICKKWIVQWVSIMQSR